MMSNNKILGVKSNFFILCVIGILFFIVWHARGYIFIISTPQSTLLTNASTPTISTLHINGQPINITSTWNIIVDQPYKYLSGVGLIIMETTSMDNDTFVAVSVCPQTKMVQNAVLDINNNQLVIGVYVRRNQDTYLSEWSEASAHCAGLIQGSFNPDTQPSGELRIENFAQSTKHLTFAGSTSLSAVLKGSNPKDLLHIDLRDLTFSINSPVIYEWSNKAGDTWRL